MIIHAKKLVVDAFQILEPGWVVIDQHGMIDAVLSSEPDETTAILQADIVTPGFIDLHNHGIGGSNEIAEYWLYPEYTTTRLAQHGVTSMLATMVWISSHCVGS